MAKSAPDFDERLLESAIALIETTFVPEDTAMLYRGPSFHLWEPSIDLLERRRDGLPIFAYKTRSLFHFGQKYLHLMSIDEKAIAVTTTVSGRPVRIQQFGTRVQIDRLLERIDTNFEGEEWMARWIAAPRFRDTLALSNGHEYKFVPVRTLLERETFESLNIENFLNYLSEA